MEPVEATLDASASCSGRAEGEPRLDPGWMPLDGKSCA